MSEPAEGAERVRWHFRQQALACDSLGSPFTAAVCRAAAEILDDDVRWVLTKGKLPAAAWIDVVATAHEVGLRSSATMMYGHVDHPRHWLGHLRVLADLPDRTG